MSAETFYVDIGTISLGGTGAVIGGDESQLLVQRLLGMYRSWAALQRVEFQQIDLNPAYGGGIRNAKFSLSGTVRSSFAALHDGTHTLIRIPPDDPNQRRHMSVAGVRSSIAPDLPPPARMDDWGSERRRYVCDPDPVINDTRLGRIEVNPDLIFAGDFSALSLAANAPTTGGA